MPRAQDLAQLPLRIIPPRLDFLRQVKEGIQLLFPLRGKACQPPLPVQQAPQLSLREIATPACALVRNDREFDKFPIYRFTGLIRQTNYIVISH